MSTKLKYELKKVKTQEHAPIESLLDSVKTLMIEYSSEQDEILKQAGLSSNPIEKIATTDFKRTKAVEEIYKAESYTGAQIKQLCNKYNLRLLPTTFYKGAVPADSADYIKAFCEKNKLPITDRELFILAPVELFQTQNFVVDRDPILFYRTDKSSSYDQMAQPRDVFSQVHNWGNDFTENRKLWFLMDDFQHIGQESSNSFKTISLILALTIFMLALAIGSAVFLLFASVILVWRTLVFSAVRINNLKNDEPWNSDKIFS